MTWLLRLDADFATAIQNNAHLGSPLGVGDQRVRRCTGDAVTARGLQTREVQHFGGTLTPRTKDQVQVLGITGGASDQDSGIGDLIQDGA